jgi:hypothetical protein
MVQAKKPLPLEDQVLSRMLSMPPDPKIAKAKKKPKPRKK